MAKKDKNPAIIPMMKEEILQKYLLIFLQQ